MSTAKGTKVGSVTIQGKDYEVRVTEHLRFLADVGEVKVYASDAQKLQEQIATELRKQRIEHAIGVVLDYKGAAVRAVLRGQNVRTRAFLLTLADGTKIAEDHPVILALDKDVTDEQIAALNRLAEATATAASRATAYRRSLRNARGEHLVAWALIQQAERAAGIKD